MVSGHFKISLCDFGCLCRLPLPNELVVLVFEHVETDATATPNDETNQPKTNRQIIDELELLRQLVNVKSAANSPTRPSGGTSRARSTLLLCDELSVMVRRTILSYSLAGVQSFVLLKEEHSRTIKFATAIGGMMRSRRPTTGWCTWGTSYISLTESYVYEATVIS